MAGLRFTLLSAVLCCCLLPPAVGEQQTPESPPRLTPIDPGSLEALAAQKYREGELELAAALYRELGRRTEGAARSDHLVTSAWLATQLGRLDEARADLRAALAERPDHPIDDRLYPGSFLALIEQARESAGGERRRQALLAVDRAVEAERGGDLATARRELAAALELTPTLPTALLALARLELGAAQPTEACDHLERLLAGAEPTPQVRATALVMLGIAHSRRAQDEDAERALREAVTLDAEQPEGWANLGAVLLRRGRRDEALGALRRARELAPDDLPILRSVLATCVGARSWDEALEVGRTSVARFPDDAGLWLHLGLAQKGTGELDAALSSLQRAETLATAAPELAGRAATYQAAVLLAQGRTTEALDASQRGLRSEPRSLLALAYRANAQQALGDLPAAQATLEAALRIDPRRADLHNNLGGVLLALGDRTAAVRAFQQALAIDPELAAAAANLAALDGARPSPGGEVPPSPPPPFRTGIRWAELDYTALALRGALVEALEPGSAGERAGLRRGDLVIRVDGQPIANPAELESLLAAHPADRVTLDLLRDAQPRQLVLARQ